MSPGVLYYTSNNLDKNIEQACVKQLQNNFTKETVAVSLKPLNTFRRNFVVDGIPSYTTMVRQIIRGLEELSCDYVFFVEHDVLYHKSHFEFVPELANTFYYNTNVWRWDYPSDRMVRWDKMFTLSQLVVNKKFALDHYRRRLTKIYEFGYDQIQSREPDWARKWGYEPGTKKPRNGGFSADVSDTWKSLLPNIDIRHKGTFSPAKVTLDSFKHQPTGWKETTKDKIFGWNLNELFL